MQQFKTSLFNSESLCHGKEEREGREQTEKEGRIETNRQGVGEVE